MGRPVTMTNARGMSRFSYDPLGRLLSVKDALEHETTYRYDENGNRIEEINARLQITRHEYDAKNRLAKTTRPDGTVVTYTHNFRDQVLSETISGPEAGGLGGGFPESPQGNFYTTDILTVESSRTTSFTYDDAGQLVKITFPDLSEVNFTYDELGRIRTIKDPRDKVTTYEYDANCGCTDRLVKITGPNGKFSQYTYDDTGRNASFIDANNRQRIYTYDVRDHVIKATLPDSQFVETSYDGMGRVLTNTDQEGRVTKYGYDDVGNLVSVTDAKNQVTQYSYDSLGNVLSVTDGNQRVTRYEYDALSRVIKRILPLGMSDLYTYDEVGNLATRTDFRGKQTAYEWDSMDRMVTKRPDLSLGEPAISYTYTDTGRRKSMTDASGTTNYTYDLRDRPLSKQTPQGTLFYTYDLSGNLLSMQSSNANGINISYTYDDLNRLETVIDGRLTNGTTNYTYDPVGNLKTDLLPNGVMSDYTYNLTNRLTNLSVAKQGTALASYAYTLDKTGRRLSATELGGRTTNYTYDAVYKLTREAITGNQNPANNGTVDYTYDAVGNRLSRISNIAAILSKTSTYDDNDRLTSELYDANGNARSVDGRSYTYDFENRLKSAGGPVNMVYDGDGNLAAKTVGGVTTRYLIDDLNPTGYAQVIEELVDGMVQKQYTYGNAIISQRQQVSPGNWTTHFYTLDGHGSVRQLTNASGVVTDTYAFDAFGKIISQTGSTSNPYLYAGERFDADLGIYHLRARYYNPDRGRFMSMDPYPGDISEPFSLHKYLYANADAVNFIDPSGLATTAEYAQQAKLMVIRAIQFIKRLGRVILCLMIKTCSIIASIAGYEAWAVVMQWAERLLMRHCPCKFMRVLDIVGDILGTGLDIANSVRPAAEQPFGSPGNPLGDGEGATPEEIARSSGGPNAGSRDGAADVRQREIDRWRRDHPGEPFKCWRCGTTSTDPDDMHLGHRNKPVSKGGNSDPVNTALEGASCNLSAGNRGRPKKGRDCASRGSCGAPYGR
jgi:RHS repeat-associated protein